MTSLCCSENHKVIFCFLVCSLALCKILPQKLLCTQQKPSLLIPVTGIIEGQKVKTTCVSHFHNSEISSVLSIYVLVPFCGTFISFSTALLLINLHLVNNHLLSVIWIRSTILRNLEKRW